MLRNFVDNSFKNNPSIASVIPWEYRSEIPAKVLARNPSGVLAGTVLGFFLAHEWMNCEHDLISELNTFSIVVFMYRKKILKLLEKIM